MDTKRIMQLYLDRINYYQEKAQESLEKKDYEKADYYSDKVEKYLAVFEEYK
jgi:predicted P-loop ATPase